MWVQSRLVEGRLWCLLCEGGTADCSVLVPVYSNEGTQQHDSQYNTLQPPHLVPLLLGYPW
jgi:hypothetical protein